MSSVKTIKVLNRDRFKEQISSLFKEHNPLKCDNKNVIKYRVLIVRSTWDLIRLWLQPQQLRSVYLSLPR
jgi:hypothetical protein